MIVLVEKSREELNRKLELWRQTLQAYNFYISKSKMEYMKCKFNKRYANSNSEVKIEGDTIPQVTIFKHIGYIMQNVPLQVLFAIKKYH